MTAHAQIARDPAAVKSHLLEQLSGLLDSLLDDDQRRGRELENAVWSVLITFGNELLGALLALACWRTTVREVEQPASVRFRLDRDYWVSQTTTLGTVQVPLFAYRDAAGQTHAPARTEVFPLHPHCRSSELCLEWEARLGSDLPFRQAQEALTFFTHDATKLEDSTIARHASLLGAVVDRSWTYQTTEQIREVLWTRATRDGETGRPLLYLSTDAHALRRYVDDSFAAPWKMINGIRMWCVDKGTGRVIHLGGEYTWGDCQEVAERFEAIVRDYVPDGEEAPQVVLLTDGMEWIRKWVAPKMPEGTVIILDFYHAVEHIAAYARDRFGQGTPLATSWYNKVRTQLYGKRGYRRKKRKTRRGPRKHRSTSRRRRTIHRSEDTRGAGEALVWTLLEEDVPEQHGKAFGSLLHYVSENADRMDYPRYRERGIQVGSGAMESLHRIASQMRLKLAGARWLAENALAVLNLRMMRLAGHWGEFWGTADLTERLVQASTPRPEATP
ncbi:MAG: hypothetical protein GY772_22380 [bacterium]|nr:hypothetical protein [bacterium]